MDNLTPLGSAVIIGAGGGIGAAFVRALAASGRFERTWAFSRSGLTVEGASAGRLDLLDEDSIRAAADAVAQGPALRLVIVATGLLHDGAAVQPEKALRAVDPDALARLFAINATGPILVAKHFTPLFPKTGRAVFAALSARVGSIADNGLGGWYGYRASKAALNMLIRTLSIELARTRPEAVCLALHPGTVDTGLSQPFQPKGERGHILSPDESARRLLAVIDGAGPGDSGAVLDHLGARVPY